MEFPMTRFHAHFLSLPRYVNATAEDPVLRTEYSFYISGTDHFPDGALHPRFLLLKRYKLPHQSSQPRSP